MKQETECSLLTAESERLRAALMEIASIDWKNSVAPMSMICEEMKRTAKRALEVPDESRNPKQKDK